MELVEALRSIGEPTRLRVVALLLRGELSVGELVEILGMSQPRLSRHLKLLTDAGIIERLPEGAWVFYRLPSTGNGRDLVDALSQFIPLDSPDFARDRQRLTEVRIKRASAAEDYFNRTAESWDDVRGKHYPSQSVEAALLDALKDRTVDTHIDLGTGTGRMLTLFSDKVEHAEGIDLSHKMLTIARTNLEKADIRNCHVRHGDVTAPPFDNGCAELVTIHQVLHYLDDPQRVIAEAARIMKPGGRLLIVDFAPHALEFLRTEHEHRRLGLSDEEIEHWTQNSGLTSKDIVRFPSSGDEGLTVNIWAAEKPQTAGDTAA